MSSTHLFRINISSTILIPLQGYMEYAFNLPETFVKVV
jgi:hypothetical protein